MSSPLRVTVLRGGISTERAVSLRSGQAVAEAARRAGFRVHEADISPDDTSALDEPADVIFPVLHGPFGEDGKLQILLEKRRQPFVGSGSTASALAMDKCWAKSFWLTSGLPTPPFRRIDKETNKAEVCPFPLPVVVKPAHQGSSVGLSIIHDRLAYRRAVTEGVERWETVLVEPLLRGREFTVSILGDRVLPIIEVVPEHGVYDYAAKYERGTTRYEFDLGLDADETDAIADLCLRACRVIGCRDLGRVDLIADERFGPQLLELNTMPGFTAESLFPRAAARVGLTLEAVVEQLVHAAYNRKDR